MKRQLVETLASVGKTTEVYRSPDGTEVLLLPYGGRVLGLFAPESEENFYWTHPALDSADSARQFYECSDWHNSGGDRTWLAPEVDFFLPNFPKTDVYWQPRELDPGNYQVVQDGQGLRLVNRATCLLSRSGCRVEVQITKWADSAPNPLRCERGLKGLNGVQYAGYTQHTSLTMLAAASDDGGPVGLWNLIQMPHGGEMLVPLYVKTEPKVLFGSIGAEDLRVQGRLLSYAMRAPGEHKIGLRAVAMTGRIGYQYATQDGRWALVVRNAFVNPSGHYVDVPWSDPDDRGYAVQACNVNSRLGSFSELEYHVPAIGSDTGRSHCEDVSQVWAFRGSRQQIHCIVENLLTTDRRPDL